MPTKTQPPQGKRPSDHRFIAPRISRGRRISFLLHIGDPLNWKIKVSLFFETCHKPSIRRKSKISRQHRSRCARMAANVKDNRWDGTFDMENFIFRSTQRRKAKSETLQFRNDGAAPVPVSAGTPRPRENVGEVSFTNFVSFRVSSSWRLLLRRQGLHRPHTLPPVTK